MSELDSLRQELDDIDRVLIEYFEKRCQVAKQVGLYKIKNNLAVKDHSRERAVIQKRLEYLKDREFFKEADFFIRTLMAQSRKIQRKLLRENSEGPEFGNLYIVGLPGCGKSTIGRVFAEEEGMNYIDLDLYIEQKTQKSVSEIFSQGEQTFRDIESECLHEIAASVKNTVIATGGGIVEREENIRLLEKMRVVYIYRPVKLILKCRFIKNRPLLAADPQKIYELEKRRRPKYEQIATYKLGNFGRVMKNVHELQRIIIKDEEKSEQ